MSASSLWPVQAAIYARLCADDALLALLPAGAGAVLDHVPQDTAFPYIVLGDMQARPLDTAADSGHDITFEILTYSQAPGMKETKALMAALYACLHRADFAITGHRLILCDAVLEECRLLADARTRESLQRFHIITEPVT